MLIDWFTVGAQALNFVILVWLMKRFLYKPILQAIDARETKIAAELAYADAEKAEAQRARAEFLQKNEELDQQRAAILRQATDEAKVAQQQILDEARKSAEALGVKHQKTLRSEAHGLSQAIGRQTREEVFGIARRVLKDLATTSLEDHISEEFIRRLRAMDNEAKARLGAALRASSEPAVVRSAFDLPVHQRTAIVSALNEAFSSEVTVRFETATNLIGGIEFAANGQKLAWSIDEYLGSLEKSVVALVGARTQPAQEITLDSVAAKNGGSNDRSD